MSFPRKVPVAQRKVNFKVRNKFLAGGMAYTVGMAAFAEYHGLFDSIRDLSSGEAQTLVQNVQLEDEKSWLRWSFKMMDKTAAKTKAVVEEQFLENLPTGVKHFLTDPRYLNFMIVVHIFSIILSMQIFTRVQNEYE